MTLYPDPPILIQSEKTIPLKKDVEFKITYLNNNKFTIESSSDNYPLQKTASFGETIEVPGGNFTVECRNEEWFRANYAQELYFIIHSQNRLVNSYVGKLDVELMSRGGSILNISISGTNRTKDVDFLNKLIEEFQASSLEKKNLEAERRIEFIDNQLIGISDSLLLTENRLQQFRSSNRIMDLSAQGQAIIAQITELENERARLNLEANYCDYLADYLAKDLEGELPIVPITMGITDPGLTRLVEELATLQGQLSARGAGQMNPLQRNLEQRTQATKEALRETLNGLRRANSLARSENQEQISQTNTRASALPVTERQLLGIERKFRINDELYTFLLETRAELAMQKASNRADSEVIDYSDSRFSNVILPNKKILNMIAIMAGLIIPFLTIYLNFLLNKKLKDEEIRKMTTIPVVGNIPHNNEKTNTVIFDNPNSTISESFRVVRSRMQFFIKEAKAPVILITSTMPGDGKTFTAINLASAYSLLGMRTILVGFDLRKPKIYQDFNLTNDKGVSTWLIGKDDVKDIIQQSPFENLWIITAGPIPPNPSELTALKKTEELFKILKEKYDYIIIDTSPIGVVSDTYHLASLADACLLVVRTGKTLRDLFENTLAEIKTSNLKSVSLVINDIHSGSKHYGYAEKYGYTERKRRLKRSLFMNNKT